MIQAIRKRLAIRSYGKRLKPWLQTQYGRQDYYSPNQVRTGASTLGLPVDPLCYAYAMFCTHADFDAHHAAIGESCNYDAMRAEATAHDSSSDSSSGSGDSGGGWFDSGGDSGGGDSGGGDGGGGGGD
jgi:uncharacterized membrane protein YgcG